VLCSYSILIRFDTYSNNSQSFHLQLCQLSLKLFLHTKTNICPVQNFLRGKSLFATVAVTLGFVCGVERVKRLVYVHFRCIVNKLKRIGLSKMSDLPPPGKISADARDDSRSTFTDTPSKLALKNACPLVAPQTWTLGKRSLGSEGRRTCIRKCCVKSGSRISKSRTHQCPRAVTSTLLQMVSSGPQSTRIRFANELNFYIAKHVGTLSFLRRLAEITIFGGRKAKTVTLCVLKKHLPAGVCMDVRNCFKFGVVADLILPQSKISSHGCRAG